MLKKSASGVLASFRPSTYPKGTPRASLAAALLDGLFEHPAGVLRFYPRRTDYRCSFMPELFFRGLLGTVVGRRSCWSRLPAAARRTATSASCKPCLSNGITGAPLMPSAFTAKRRGCGCWSCRSVCSMAIASLSDVADKAWAAAARIEGSGCLAKSAARETADMLPSRRSPSTALARTCMLASRVRARSNG